MEYDDLGRVFRMFEAGQRIVAYSYDLLSRRTRAEYHNTVVSNWAWRINDTLETVAHTYPGGANVTFEYRYNTENGVRARLVSDATYQAGAGNPALAVGTRGYAVNALNQYTAVAGTSLSYDDNGNLSGDGTWTYGHDAQGRLVSAAKAGTTIGYGYDAAGRRRSRTVNGVTVTSLWSGDQEVAEYDAAGALVRRFVWGPMGVDEILAIIGVVGGPAGRRRFQHADGLGTVVAATTGNGTLEAKFAYTPYGVADSNAGPPWRFTGRRLDPDTGLYYLRARDYSPHLGRFIQPDPIGMEGGINLYAYVGNSPLNATDPDGLQASIWDQYRNSRDPRLWRNYRSPDGISAQQSGAPNISAYTSGRWLSRITPSTADLLNVSVGLAIVAGQPQMAIALGAGLALQRLTCTPEMAPFFGRVRSSKGRTNEAQQVQR